MRRYSVRSSTSRKQFRRRIAEASAQLVDQDQERLGTRPRRSLQSPRGGECPQRLERQRRCLRLEARFQYVAEAAARRVPDAPERDAIGGIGRQPQVREQILDLAPGIEGNPADDLVAHAVLAQFGLQGTRLRIGAVEHRALVEPAAAADALRQEGTYCARLVGLVGGQHEAQPCPCVALAPQALAFAIPVVRDHGVGGIENVPGRAVVLLEPDHRGARERFLEVEHVGEIGAPPAVDGLVIIADDEQIAVPRRQRFDQAELRVVGVLVFVHQHVVETLLVAARDVGPRAHQAHHLGDEIVEVEGAAFAQRMLIALIGRGDPPLMRAHRQAFHLLGRDQRVLGVGDAVQHLTDPECPFGQAERRDHVVEHRLLVLAVVDDEVRGNALGRARARLAPQNAHAGAVERADPDPRRRWAQALLDAFAHLARGAVGERESQHRLGRGAALEQLGDACGQHACLAASRPGDDQEGAAGMLDGRALLRIELRDGFQGDGFPCGVRAKPQSSPKRREEQSPGKRIRLEARAQGGEEATSEAYR
jgi:hypothetical protein